jgi:hypothetical protein
MKFRSTSLIAVALWLLVPAFALPKSRFQPPAELQEASAPVPAQEQTRPGYSDHAPRSRLSRKVPLPLRVMVDKSLLINTTERLKRISSPTPPSPTPPSLLPRKSSSTASAPGEVSLSSGTNSNARAASIFASTSMSAPAPKKNIASSPMSRSPSRPPAPPLFSPATSPPRMSPSAPENSLPPIPRTSSTCSPSVPWALRKFCWK